MSHQTRAQYIVTGGQQEFDLAIPFLDRNHIKVTLNGSTPFFEWLTDSRIRLRPAPVENSVLQIRRDTPISTALVEFQNTATLTAEELNRAHLQNLYRLQELDDLYTVSLDRAQVRLGDHLGVVTTPDAIVDELILTSELGDAALNRFRDALATIDLSSERIIDHTLALTNQAFRMDNLTAVVDALTNLEDGTGLATVIQNEANARLSGDQALVDTFALIGAKSADNLSFILDLNKLKSSPTETMAQRFNAIYAANANALGLIQTEQTARVTAIEAVTQTLQTQGSKIGSNEAAIASEATARANAISAEASARNALSASIPGLINAAVLVETNARVAADQAEAQLRQSLAVQVGQNSTAIQNEATARANADGAIAQQFAVLGAFRNGQTAFILDLNRVEVGPGFSLGTRLTGIDVAVGNVSASVVSEATARANADSALSQTIQTVQNTVGGNTASITSLQQVTNGINARWTLALNSNGHITGITATNNGSYGTLAFVADEMSFVAPGGGSPVKIMSLVNGRVRFNSNVEIYGDLLVTGSINHTRLVSNTVSNTEAAYNAATITLNNTTPTRIHGVWISVEKADSPIDIDFNAYGTFTHNASGSFVAVVQLVRSRGTDGGTVIQSVQLNGSGMANDTWQGALPMKYLDRPGEGGNWHYYVQIYFTSNMSTQTVTARYGKVTEMKNNTSTLGGGSGSGGGVGAGGGSSGGGGGGGGGGIDPYDPGGGGYTDQPIIT
ncbi:MULTISPECIES: phage tail fiber protein [unclassified Brevundimonas]|uniref:phage tail fiber domain-containing protein n=1 Tax=unclassified Brevundimonas TaxID=2622653 RepID=UPI0025C3183F|nr:MULTISPECIES: phage tail fiber protein [unclassified Brevundimonas]